MDQGAHARYIHCYNLLFGNVSWSYRSIFLQVRRVTQQKDQHQKASTYKPGDETELQSQLLPKALFLAAIAAAILCASGVLPECLCLCHLFISTLPSFHAGKLWPEREQWDILASPLLSGWRKNQDRHTHTRASWKAVLQHSFPRTSILNFSHFFLWPSLFNV